MSSLHAYQKKFAHRFFTQIGRDKGRIRKMPRFTPGVIRLFGKPFRFHDNESFLATYHEIFEKQIYCFQPQPNKKIIIDCGANIGLSVLYFSLHYPDHTILAFEPDTNVFGYLQQNVRTFGLNNVQLFEQAVWKEATVLTFYSDGGLGGRVDHAYEAVVPRSVQAVRLRDLLNPQVDFLKLDIEGAEYPVLTDCREALSGIGHLFFEYHGFEDGPQRLHELLNMLHQNGFHYYIKESSTREKPFVDKGLICELYDMAINIFAYPH